MLPDLSRFDKVALDTETDGLGYRNRPVGLSWATPDGQSGGSSLALRRARTRAFAVITVRSGGPHVRKHPAVRTAESEIRHPKSEIGRR